MDDLILLSTSILVMWSLYQMPRTLQKHHVSSDSICFSKSAVRVQVSHAYMNIAKTSERISFIFEELEIFLSFQIGFNFARAVDVLAILAKTSIFDPSSDMIAPRYLNFSTVLTFDCLSLCLIEFLQGYLLAGWPTLNDKEY